MEPPTKGKVVLRTSSGPIELEFWPKEAPRAVRNFVQLCIDGYYDGCSFFRVVHGFVVQAGDPTNTGTGALYTGNHPYWNTTHSRRLEQNTILDDSCDYWVVYGDLWLMAI